MLIFWLHSFVPDGKLIDGQVIQLEDGSAAYVQHVPIPKSSKYLMRTLLILILQYLLPPSACFCLNLVLISRPPSERGDGQRSEGGSKDHSDVVKTLSGR